MSKIVLLELINRVLFKDAALIHLTAEMVMENRLTEGERKRIIEMLVELFCTDGLDSEEEPTPLGVEIEDLIDVLLRPSE